MKKSWLLAVCIMLGACQSGQSEPEAVVTDTEPARAVAEAADAGAGTVSKPGSPYAIDYKIIGTPVVGSPVTVDLMLRSTLDPRPMTIDYRINDASAMALAEAQPRRVSLEPADNESAMRQRVSVIPLREGRLYLNVSAAYATEEGTVSTLTAVPIQVGAGNRDLQENGRVELDEDGERIRVLENTE